MFIVLFLIGLSLLCILGVAITDNDCMMHVAISCIVVLLLLMMISPVLLGHN